MQRDGHLAPVEAESERLMHLTLSERLWDALSYAVSHLRPRQDEAWLQALLNHSQAEAGAFRELSTAAAQSTHPALRPLYLRHGLARARRAEQLRMFARGWVKRLSDAPETGLARRARLRKLAPTDAPPLETEGGPEPFERLGELPFLLHQEGELRHRHHLYRRELRRTHGGEAALRALLDALVEETGQQHLEVTQALGPLQQEVGGWHLWRLKRARGMSRAWRGWLGFSTRFAQVSNSGMLSVLYWVTVGLTRLLSPPPPSVLGWQENERPQEPSLLHAQRQF